MGVFEQIFLLKYDLLNIKIMVQIPYRNLRELGKQNVRKFKSEGSPGNLNETKANPQIW